MIHDYMKRTDKIAVAVSTVVPSEEKIFYNISFYRSESYSKHVCGKLVGSGRLTANSGEEAQDAISYAKEEDTVTIEYNYDKECYDVYAGDFIGRLPKKLEDYAESATFIIMEIGETSSGKSYVVVGAYQ